MALSCLNRYTPENNTHCGILIKALTASLFLFFSMRIDHLTSTALFIRGHHSSSPAFALDLWVLHLFRDIHDYGNQSLRETKMTYGTKGIVWTLNTQRPMHRSSTEKLNIPGSSVEELGTVKHRNKTSHDWGVGGWI